MSDLFGPLRGSDPQPGLPPAEARRLGDAHRRRRTAVRGVLAAAAVVAVVGGVALAGNRGSDAPPQPAPAPSPTETMPAPTETGPITSIDGLPLLDGYPEPGDGEITGPGRGLDVLSDLSPCDTPVTFSTVIDDVAALYSGPEDVRGRRVLLFTTAGDAEDALHEVLDAYDACPSESLDGGISESRYEVVPLGEGSTGGPNREGGTVLTTYATDGLPSIAQEVLYLRQTENSLLIASEYGEGIGALDLPAARESVGDVIDRQAAVIGALLAAAGGETPDEQPTGTADTVPDDFPLLSGWPDPASEPADDGAETRGPERSLDTVELEACGRTADLPEPVDQLGAEWSSIQNYRARELTVYADADAAVAAVDALTRLYRDCAEDPAPDNADFVTVRQVLPLALGGQAVTLVTSYEFDGDATTGLGIAHVVRLGRAVLVDTTSNESSLATLEPQLAESRAAIGQILSGMCLFTEAGC